MTDISNSQWGMVSYSVNGTMAAGYTRCRGRGGNGSLPHFTHRIQFNIYYGKTKSKRQKNTGKKVSGESTYRLGIENELLNKARKILVRMKMQIQPIIYL